MEGRDFGKLLKKGYFKGTKANVSRYQFIGATLFVACVFGGLRVYYADRFIILPKVEEYMKEFDQRMLNKHAEVEMKRLERTRAMNLRKDDGL